MAVWKPNAEKRAKEGERLVPQPSADGRPLFRPSCPTQGRIHRKLLDRLNLANLDAVDGTKPREPSDRWSRSSSPGRTWPSTWRSASSWLEQVLDEIFGLGPLEPLMKDPDVSDILVNTLPGVFIEKDGKLQHTDIRFQDDRHLLQVIDRIVSAVGRRIDDSSPMVDARLPDGSRVNAIIPPLAIDGPHLSIRKFKRDTLAGEDLLRNDSLTEPMLSCCRAS